MYCLTVDIVCFECNFTGEVIVHTKLTECPKCKTINDWWFEHEQVPQRHINFLQQQNNCNQQ